MSTRGQVNASEVIVMKNLFTIRQVSKSCGISRATILRLEDKGLLTPAFVDEQTGYRYYDNNNVSKIMQIQLFLGLGMSYDDVALYYRSSGYSPELFRQVESKFFLMKRAYEEIRLRFEPTEPLRFEFVTLPEYVCYAKEFHGTTVEDRYWAMYNLYHEAVEKGYRLLASEPLFIINKRTDFIEGTFSEREVDFICCVPLESDSAPEDAVVYPSCQAFSCLFRGNYNGRAEAFNIFGAKIRELGLKPTGYVRALALVAPYTSLEIPADNYVSRLVVPVEG